MIFALLFLNRRASSARINVQIVRNQFWLDEALFWNRKRLMMFQIVVLFWQILTSILLDGLALSVAALSG